MIARFYFSLRSPYSWLAYRDLLTHHPDVADILEWRPFWEPDDGFLEMLTEAGGRFPYVDMSRAKALYILQDVRRLANQRGLKVAWPVDRKPRWEVSHLAYLVAQRHGKGPEFIAGVYRARWEQARDISDPETIAAIGSELDLDPVELVTAEKHPEIRDAALRALQAVDADGVFGVPFFVVGREKFWGVDRLPDVVAAVRARQSAPEPVPESAVAEPVAAAGDLGHAGGCG
ncbi:MAG TPA: DsbA family protein [Micromonosporaceae bacterium]